MLKTFLGWATAINFGILVFWALLLFGFYKKFFGFFSNILKGSTKLTADTFNHINLQGITIYEILWYVFNFVPWVILNFIMV